MSDARGPSSEAPAGEARTEPSSVEDRSADLAPDAGPRTSGAGQSSPTLEISNAIVRLMKQHYGKGPTSVRTHLLGDAVVVLTHGGFTKVEHTLNELGHEDAVIDQRQTFKDAMTEPLRDVVAQALGREVLAVLSATHVDPDIACETFILAPVRTAPAD
ncbi:Na-translocating system protein MpsC family protein [Patulibacter minatonensis]|uniref:Na-translocating system protein MpsC family protein n=1 Tax=Patulibacter minatonensis TaxID=298163 RepID=UPI00047A0D90|nr:Na-translocating system protein MpsC family protein [Patulibacter minatonensis]